LSEVIASAYPTRIQFFTSSAEALTTYPDTLDRTAPMPKDAYDSAVPLEPYLFAVDDRVPCQLVTKQGGGMCNQIHGRGFIITRKDGMRGFIGRDCSLGHFGVHHAFARAAARADRQLEVQQAADRLRALLTDDQLRARLHDAFKKQQTLAHRVRSVRKELPTSLLQVLHDMAKTNRSNVVVEFERRELIENKEGKEVEVSKWEPTTIGVLGRPDALDLLAVDALAERFRHSRVTFDEARATSDQPKKRLVAWTRVLDDIDVAACELGDAEDALTAFIDVENLKRLCWLVHDSRDQLQIARYVLKRQRGSEVSEQAARRPLEDWGREVRAPYQGRRFRIR
jgi:hypothetical protein